MMAAGVADVAVNVWQREGLYVAMAGIVLRVADMDSKSTTLRDTFKRTMIECRSARKPRWRQRPFRRMTRTSSRAQCCACLAMVGWAHSCWGPFRLMATCDSLVFGLPLL
jgi:hypothetical protein